MDQPQDRRPAAHEFEAAAQPHAGRSAEREAEVGQRRALLTGPAGIVSGQLRQALGKDPAAAEGVHATKAADGYAELDSTGSHRQVRQSSEIAAMATLRASPAERTAGKLSCNSEVQDDAGAFDQDSLHAKAREVRK